MNEVRYEAARHRVNRSWNLLGIGAKSSLALFAVIGVWRMYQTAEEMGWSVVAKDAAETTVLVVVALVPLIATAINFLIAAFRFEDAKKLALESEGLAEE